MIERLLVANRGEIACRIIRTARAMGITSVAVHSATDSGARHVREADLAVDLGGERPAQSYLLGERIIAAAQASGAQAIHPGYGFLSENAAFARACEAAGLIFLGPPAAAIEAMGDKAAAKALMGAAGVPLVPGYHGAQQDQQSFRKAAEQIGYPVLLKASAGGGGKGMKVVEKPAELAEALESARREAQAAFGDARLLVEKYLARPRHVEIQVFADRHGHCLYLHERDCSIQRRHQKVVEEAPAPGLSTELRAAMGQAAVRAAQAIGYVGAGTVEFLLDDQGGFYFMEMNTRLQVEHPVTEAITGLDLVSWQIRVACGEVLPFTQAQLPLQGHAIEVRLYAEDPLNDFLPASGLLQLYREPTAGEGRRVDSGVAEGDHISPFYDPLLAKLVAWGETREQARLRLLGMLDELCLAGVRSNRAFLQRILAEPAFAAAELDTGFIERHRERLLQAPGAVDESFWALAADAWLQSEPAPMRGDDPHSPWAARSGWRAGMPATSTLHLVCDAAAQRLQAPGQAHLEGEWLVHSVDGVEQRLRAIRQGDTLYLQWRGALRCIRRFDPTAAADAGHGIAGGLNAPMSGSIVRVLVEVGQQVEQGQALLVLEAMKMEHSIRAPHAGTIGALHCSEGEMVTEGAVLVELREA
ncbi:acetyl/propionyl/methylcrotonyl-CoA carboxylase subunit alpha [Pseudomonas mangrovi]|uniref:Biotin carboxylase n=1 Tax=Pseudomonas mangrovi TaxID=2161748 RepID=A0A2T5P7H6_9PSED|nr:acetyl/propionyl/methylcrotonyl-CoA carboxylase subunit alpha [Pseudomonas mangrovi]PTU73702.1 3-methylcrotonyl-CoA carboxylase [Pseudomonas mangrovi]